MKISIVVICLNEEKNLPCCLGAIRNLDHAGLDVELLVVDGGSTDRSCEVARSFGAQVIHSLRGIPRQRNVGGRAATGEILAFVDADVEILPGWFECVARHFGAPQERRERQLLGAAPLLPDDATWVSRTFALHWGAPTAQDKDEVTEDHRMLATASLVMDRAIFVAEQSFDEAMAVDEDTVFVLQAKQAGVRTLCDPHLVYIHHGEPRSLQDFFRRTRWGANYGTWLDALKRGDRALMWRPQYLYGAAMAFALGCVGISLFLPGGIRQRGVPMSLGMCAALVLGPALRTTIRHHAYERLAPLCAIYGTYALALGTSLWSLKLNKALRWR